MNKLTASLLTFMLIGLTGCPPTTPTLPPSTSGGGWVLETVFIDEAVVSLAPETTATGDWLADSQGATGSASPFTVTTNEEALAIIADGRAPATWSVTWVSSLSFPDGCNGQTYTLIIGVVGALAELDCYAIPVEGYLEPFMFSPSPLYVIGTQPTSTITGQGFSSQYGMPVVQYFNPQGQYVDEMSATSISSNGTQIQAATPNLSGLSPGTYVGIVNNVNANGSYTPLGGTYVLVMSEAPTPPTNPCPGQKVCSPT